MNSIEYKPVSLEEMNNLILKSKDVTHPYYYKFQYSIKEHKIIANRIRKNLLQYSMLRRNFHQTDVSFISSYCKVIRKTEKYKNRILENYGIVR